MPPGKTSKFSPETEGILCGPAKPGSSGALSRLQFRLLAVGLGSVKQQLQLPSTAAPLYTPKAQNSSETEAQSKGQNHPKGKQALDWWIL